MLTEAVVNDLVNKLNAQVDIPFVGEATEAAAIKWLVERVTRHIPEWVVELMASAADGLDMADMKTHEAIIVEQINKLVDIPGTPEFIEAKLIQFIVHGMLEYALSGNAAPTE